MEQKTDKELERKKKWLRRYKRNVACLNRLEHKLLELDEKIYKIKSPNYSGMPRGGKPLTIEEILSDKIELENRIDRITSKGKKIRAEIIEKLDELEDYRQVEVLELFFIDCMDFDEIAEFTGYTKRHVIKMYSSAIRSISLDVH